MNGRPWSRHDRYLLMLYAETTSQAEAAVRLGRTLKAVQTKCRDWRVRWRGGCVSIEEIASDLQCSPTTVSRAARALGLGPSQSKGNGRRYALDVAQADRLRRVVEGLLRVHKAHRAAGRRRGQDLLCGCTKSTEHQEGAVGQ